MHKSIEYNKSPADVISGAAAFAILADTYLDESDHYPVKLGFRHNFPTSAKTHMKNRKHRKIAKRSKKVNRKK